MGSGAFYVKHCGIACANDNESVCYYCCLGQLGRCKFALVAFVATPLEVGEAVVLLCALLPLLMVASA